VGWAPTRGLSEAGGTLRLALIGAAAAAVVVMLGLFSSGVRYGCLGLVALVVFLTAPERRRTGSGWWDILIAGFGVSVLGALLSEAAETVGGILALGGGAMIIIAATIGFPPGE
jgi:hypothetical protein